MKLYLARHAQTIENDKGIIQGHLRGRLSILGKRQAQELGEKLRHKRLDYIYTSDLSRAIDTLKHINVHHTNTPVISTKELREADFREYRGVKKESLDWTRVTDIESQEELQKRAREFYLRLLETHQKENILCMSHAGTIKALISVIQDRPYEDIWGIKTPKNAEYSLFEV